jgi:hypothetical protein
MRFHNEGSTDGVGTCSPPTAISPRDLLEVIELDVLLLPTGPSSCPTDECLVIVHKRQTAPPRLTIAHPIKMTLLHCIKFHITIKRSTIPIPTLSTLVNSTYRSLYPYTFRNAACAASKMLSNARKLIHWNKTHLAHLNARQ